MKKDFEVITPDSEFWPQGLKKISRLWVCGDVSLLKKPGISIVGTRNPSGRRTERAKACVDALGKNLVIISGLASGIDETAHARALEKGFKTIGVLGTPIDQTYPKEHSELQKKVSESGLLVSQFEPGTEVRKYFFMQRNLTMSRISKATVVVESSDGGGGVGQARYTEADGKPVFIPREVYENKSLLWPRSFRNSVIIENPDEIYFQLLKWEFNHKVEVQLELF